MPEWFGPPPYWAAWGAGALLLLLLGTLILLIRPRSAPAERMAAVPPASSVPSVSTVPVPPTPELASEAEELPLVQVRTRPAPPANTPAPSEVPGNSPSNSPAGNTPAAVPPKNAKNAPGEMPGLPVPTPGADVTPKEREQRPDVTTERITGRGPVGLEAPRVEIPAPVEPAPRVEEVAPPRVTPEPRERRERRRPPVVAIPPMDTGRMSIYFDADSSTFDRRERRLPLRVEVYVDGLKVMETTDPEKREFSVGRLEAGTHEIRIQPYVGNAPSEPRWDIIQIEPDAQNRFEAVLRKSRGISRVSKFRRQD